ncbi:MAG: DNA topoisomerase (ATP-hydrolyzing) subunit A [Caldisericota bacterium]|nr:DNA topoisomerase (ATP-hydrolyzing) subunit A [Caldisericota bacterium]
MPENERVFNVYIEEEMKKSYLDYSMSVIIGRALPDFRDGLKPVHRRILYAMYELGCFWNKPYKKSARIVGDVLGKFHPHGDTAIYDSLVRMAQEFSLRYPLVDGHGNFGSIDGDSAAAMRYTEVRLAPISALMLDELDKEIVTFVPNFDNSLEEPTILPAQIPQLLLNGTSGIAVGMATSIPPHNLGELADALNYMLECRISGEPLDIGSIRARVKGPDFPGGGVIAGTEGVDEYIETGRGNIVCRGKYSIEKEGSKTRLVITELPFEVNKAEFVQKVAGLMRDKRLSQLSDLRDESNREGIRVVLELKRDAIPERVDLLLRKHTQFQEHFHVSMLGILNGVPRTLSLTDVLSTFLDFREATLGKKFGLELRKNEERLNVLKGLVVAIHNVKSVTDILTSSTSLEEASRRLSEEFALNERQVEAILEMRMRSLVSLEVEKLNKEAEDKSVEISRLAGLLADPNRVRAHIRDELSMIARKFGNPRRTQILGDAGREEDDDEQFIEDKEVMVVISRNGYAKTIPSSTFKVQGRGGLGVASMNLKRDDYISKYFTIRTKQRMLLFTNKGRVYSIPAYKLPEEKRQGSGENLSLLLGMQVDELVTEATALPAEQEGVSFIIVTRRGRLKKMVPAQFMKIRSTGKTFIRLSEEDSVVSVRPVRNVDEVLIASDSGHAVRIRSTSVRAMGAAAGGVRGMRLSRGGRFVVGMEVLCEGVPFTLITEHGHGKRLNPYEVRLVGRGSGGVICYRVTDKTGHLAAFTTGSADQDIIVSTSTGQTIRTPADRLPLLGRNSSGVKVIRLKSKGSGVIAAEAIIKEAMPSEAIDEADQQGS